MRKKLKVLRVQEDLTQLQMAKKLNVSRQNYQAIEGGLINGSFKFWVRFQNTFNIPDADM